MQYLTCVAQHAQASRTSEVWVNYSSPGRGGGRDGASGYNGVYPVLETQEPRQWNRRVGWSLHRVLLLLQTGGDMPSPGRVAAGAMVERLTFRRRHCYATKSNKVQKVKTPGAQRR